ncbi:HupE/UreJ family protein [Salinimonas sediminis]|uniref:HupE/UreJ family protein n=1 Tax=Salinimonas sediminis TaxID=2303538 RepID=A0A346NQA4_9ALTE|nr:HupE/UreJ family protein [Salinimonas sediminis]AXR07711.1 HupE/UreJ family protein [Salinimonas sediminis]
MRLCIIVFLLSCIFLLTSIPARGHELSNGYLSLTVNNDEDVSGTLLLQPFDLEQTVGLDTNTDGQLTWAEVLSRSDALHRYVNEHLVLSTNAQPCPATLHAPTLHSISSQTLIGVAFSFACPASSNLTLQYSAIFSEDPTHKVLFTAAGNDLQATQTQVLTAQADTVELSGTPIDTWATVGNFVYEGIIHIWIGIDHILFLIATLLTVNLYRQHNQWQAESSKRTVLRHTFYLVTAFTLAHSLTLTSTALGWYSPSSRWVELGIAISVLLTALNNIWPVIHRLGWVTFAFGLLHGMGFASVFAELQSVASKPLLTIASFNVGVEIGQLAIVALLLPLLLGLRKVKAYAQFIMPTASSIIALIAVSWAIQRW